MSERLTVATRHATGNIVTFLNLVFQTFVSPGLLLEKGVAFTSVKFKSGVVKVFNPVPSI